MSWLLARIYDRFMSKTEEACLRDWRAELLADVEGDVLEIGAGTGANLPHYGPRARVTLAEPDRHMRRVLEGRAADARFSVIDAGVEALPADDASVDIVVATLLLCSVPDQARALGEIRRVLRPGGRFVFLEHMAAVDDPGRLRWQRRVEPAWKRISDGCCVTRLTDVAIEQSGFTFARLERASMRKAWPWLRPTIRGVAIRNDDTANAA